MAERDTPSGETDYRERTPLTQLQIAFCDHYARGMTGAEAARTAGYSPKGGSDKQAAMRLLRTQRVRDLIKAKREIYARASLVTAADIVDRMWDEARDPENKGFERIKALELLGRALGMFTERQAGAAAGPMVTVYLPDNGRQAIVGLEGVPAAAEDVG